MTFQGCSWWELGSSHRSTVSALRADLPGRPGCEATAPDAPQSGAPTGPVSFPGGLPRPALLPPGGAARRLEQQGEDVEGGVQMKGWPPAAGEGHGGSCSLTAPWRPSPLLEDGPPCAGGSDDEGVTAARAAPPAERALVIRPYPSCRRRLGKALMDGHAGWLLL